MTDKPYPRQDGRATVTFDPERCRHAAACVGGLPGVFDTTKRPWIQPDHASVEELGEVISRCPSGALHLEFPDGRRIGK